MRKFLSVLLMGAALAACGQGQEAAAPAADNTPAFAGDPRIPEWANVYMNKPITQSFAQIVETCDGSVDGVAQVYEEGGVRVSGWGWNEATSTAYDTILGVDSAGRVIGAGATAGDRPDVVTRRAGAVTTPRVGYELITTVTPAVVSVFGVDASTQSACLLGAITIEP